MHATVKEDHQAERDTNSNNRQYLVPKVNIVEAKDAYLLEAEMPGVSKDGLEVLLEGTELTLVGHRSKVELEAEPIHRESNPRDYRRVFELDPTIDTGKIDAKIENGVLKLYLPKTEAVKPRKIKVN